MNENFFKVDIGNTRKTKLRLNYNAQSYWVKPSGKFWKRYFNKRVRKGKIHKRDNWWEWS